MDADPDFDFHAQLPGHAGVEALQTGQHRQTRVNGVVGISQVGHRRAENGQETITQIFVHDAVVFKNDGPHVGEKAVEQPHRFARAELFDQDGKAANVDIDQGQGFEFLDQPRGRPARIEHFFQHLFGHELLENAPQAALGVGHGHCLPVKMGVFQGDAHRSGNRLQQVLIAGGKVAGGFIEHFDGADHPALGNHRHAEG